MGKHKRPWWKPGGGEGNWTPEPESPVIQAAPGAPDEVVLIPIRNAAGVVIGKQAVYRRFVRDSP